MWRDGNSMYAFDTLPSESETNQNVMEQVEVFGKQSKSKSSQKADDKENSTSG